MQHTSTASTAHTDPHHEEGDINLVATWLTFDLPRLIAGWMAGIFAGVVALAFAGVLSRAGGLEFLYPLKLSATPLMGNMAETTGAHLTPVIIGAMLVLGICSVLGAVYAHFTQTNKLLPLLGAGVMWGNFSWIFINNLFSKSFLDIRTAAVPPGAAFFITLVFGLSLCSIRIFDRIVCGRAR